MRQIFLILSSAVVSEFSFDRVSKPISKRILSENSSLASIYSDHKSCSGEQLGDFSLPDIEPYPLGQNNHLRSSEMIDLMQNVFASQSPLQQPENEVAALPRNDDRLSFSHPYGLDIEPTPLLEPTILSDEQRRTKGQRETKKQST